MKENYYKDKPHNERKINRRELLKSALAFISEQLSNPETFTTKILYRGPAQTKLISLTFDDFANYNLLKELINLAKNYNVKMVWFLIGTTINQQNLDIILQAIETGLIRIGNHSFSHNINVFNRLNENNIHQEIIKWEKIFEKTGVKLEEIKRYFRPPGGAGGYHLNNKQLLKILSKLNYKYLVMWDIEFIYTTRHEKLPYNSSTLSQIAINGVEKTKGGNIILAHINPIDIKAIHTSVEYLLNRGYRFVFPEELFLGNS